MPFRYFVKQLLWPPGLLLLLLVLAWWLRRSRPRLATCCFVLGAGGFWLMSLPVVVQWGAKALEREPPLARSEWASLAERADVIVVLGAGRERGDLAWGTDQPTGVALDRERYAARLAKASGLPVLTSGGLQRRKPAPATFTHALELLGWDAASTLFVDDRFTNVQGAREAGLHAETVTGGRTLGKALKRYAFGPQTGW